MKKKILLTLTITIFLIALLLYFYTNSKSTQPEIKWSKTFGDNTNEEGWYVKSTDDGGCVVLGIIVYNDSYETKNQDIYLIKIDGNGNKEWERNYGGNGDDYGKAIIETNDGYIIAGTSNSGGLTEFDYNAWLIKTDSNGNEGPGYPGTWNKTYGGVYKDGANSIIETKNENYIVTGFTYPHDNKDGNLWVFKINKTGEVIWNKTFGGVRFDEGRSLVETDDGYVIAGQTYSYSKEDNYSDAWLFKVNKTGYPMWNTTFDGFGYDDLFNQIIQSDDGFIMVGNVQNKTENELYDEYSDGYIVITDENGNSSFERIIEEDQETGISSVEKTDDSYLVTGYIGPFGTGEGDILVEKIDNSSNRVWMKTYGGDYSDAGIWIDGGSENNYFITGYEDLEGTGSTDVWVMKIQIN